MGDPKALEEHGEAVTAARSHLAAAGGRLSPLPDDFVQSRWSLHRVAEQVLKPKRERETGGRISLGFIAGGFGTAEWQRGEASGSRGQIRVEGTEVVLVEAGEQRRAEIGDLRAEAQLTGGGSDGIEAGGRGGVDPTAAAALTSWFAFGTVVLAELLERYADADPEPIRLWPEHFDVATVLGSEQTGSRTNAGASPGDADHDAPYLYVGPWVEQSGDLWNATAFPGAEMTYAELLKADDPVSSVLAFMTRRIDSLL